MPSLAYILAASHSGSTLLAMLLNAHPEICSVGELKAINLGDVDRYRCSCGELIRRCGFWRKVSQAMAKRGYAFDVTNAGTHYSANGSAYARRLLRPLHRGPLLEALRDTALGLSPTWRKHFPEIQRRNAALVESLLEVTGKRIVVDSSKIGLRLKYLLRNPAVDVKVIRLIRDGRAVTLTYVDPSSFADAADPALRGGGCGGDPRLGRLSLAQAARQWRRCNEEAESVLRGLDRSRWVEIRYEELCAGPQAALNRIFAHLGVGPVDVAGGFRCVPHHVLGNGMRMDATSEIRLDERWRTVLSEEDLALFEPVAGEMNRRYGYE